MPKRHRATLEVVTAAITLYGSSGAFSDDKEADEDFTRDLATAIADVYERHGHDLHGVRMLSCEQMVFELMRVGRDM